VLIAEQHPDVVTALKRSILDIFPHAIFHVTEDGASALLLLNKHDFQLAIINEFLPILSGIEVIEKCSKTLGNKINFIFTSTKHNFNTYQKAIKLGVSVFIDKGQIENEIKYGIRALQNGTIFLCACLTEEIEIINRFADKLNNLSHSERIFLGELKEGKSIKEISDKLVISSKSVKQITSKICAIIEIPADKNTLSSWAINHKHYFN